MSQQSLPFVKMHGAGNDYVYIDTQHVPVPHPELLAPYISHRHFGVGGDGLILITPSQQAHVGMRIFNADGSEAEMCGNGIRCVAKYAYEQGISQQNPLQVETAAGIKTVQLFPDAAGRVSQVQVALGAPAEARLANPAQLLTEGHPVRRLVLPLSCGATTVYTVSMGNPHCVVLVEDVAACAVTRLGPEIETADCFPARTNVEFVQIVSAGELRQRTWERGAGETLACGTGAAAATVVAYAAGYADNHVNLQLEGGQLQMTYEPGQGVWMTGPAAEVCRGWYLPPQAWLCAQPPD